MENNNTTKFPSREWFEMMKKQSSKNEEITSSQNRVAEDPSKGIIRFLLNERERFIRNR